MKGGFWMLGVLALQGCQPDTAQQNTSAPVVDPAQVKAFPAVSAVAAAPAPVAAKTTEAPAHKSAPASSTQEPAKVSASTPANSSGPVAAAAPAPKPESPVSIPAQPAVAEADALALAKKRNCFACHSVNSKIVGPAWKEVAAKYRGDNGAQARLVVKIGKGGGGVWGSMAMPPQTQATEEERTTLVRFILNLP